MHRHSLLWFSFASTFTLTGNLTIMSLTWVDRRLHTPMYLFLSALSFLWHLLHPDHYPQDAGRSPGQEKKHFSHRLWLADVFLLGTWWQFTVSFSLWWDMIASWHLQPLRYPLLMTNMWKACGSAYCWLYFCDRLHWYSGLFLQSQPCQTLLLSHEGCCEAVLSRQRTHRIHCNE